MGANQRMARQEAGWLLDSQVPGRFGRSVPRLVQRAVYRPSWNEGAGTGVLQRARQSSVMILMEDCDPLQVVKSIWPEAEVA